MDFVNQAYLQLVELLRSMSVGTRIATALLLVVVVVSFVYQGLQSTTTVNAVLLNSAGPLFMLL